jgi:hypothetical protein
MTISPLKQAWVVVLLAGAGAVQAFDIPPPPPPVYQGLIFPLFPNGHTIPFSGEAGTGRGTRATASAAKPTLAQSASQVSANAQQLAAVFPVAQRAQVAQAYVQSFDAYRQLEAKLGIPANDVAGAVAAFIAGNYMAYRGVEVPDDHYKRLVAQMRGALAESRGFAAASPGDKRGLYEQMAMVGTFMAVARQAFVQNPNPGAEKNFRDSARANLETALKVPADRVRIGANGLSLQ